MRCICWQGSHAHVLKDIGTLDHCATMMSFGSSALTLSTLPIRQQQERKAGCYSGSTNQILSGVPQPDSGHFQAKKWSTPPGLTPISGYRPTSSRPNSIPDTLPDVSQMDLSQSTCFSLSPGEEIWIYHLRCALISISKYVDFSKAQPAFCIFQVILLKTLVLLNPRQVYTCRPTWTCNWTVGMSLSRLLYVSSARICRLNLSLHRYPKTLGSRAPFCLCQRAL